MSSYQGRSELSLTYVFVCITVLASLAFAALGMTSEITAGPAHDNDMFAGIGYVIAAVWGVPAVLAALMLTAGRLFTEQHGTRLGLAVAAFALNLAPWTLLYAAM